MISITFRSRVEFENLDVQNRLKTAPFHGYMFASPRIVVRVDFHLRIYRDTPRGNVIIGEQPCLVSRVYHRPPFHLESRLHAR